MKKTVIGYNSYPIRATVIIFGRILLQLLLCNRQIISLKLDQFGIDSSHKAVA